MKLARVNLEAESFGDPRFAHLERLLGLPPYGGKLALVRCAVIWSWQVANYTPAAPCFHAPEEVVEMALEVPSTVGVPALIRARLGEETPDGLRMRGSSHERTGWLWRIRQRSAAGVEAKRSRREATDCNDADDSSPMVDHGLTTGEPAGSPQVNPLSSLLSDRPEDPKESLARAGDVAGAEPLTLQTPGKRPRKPRPPSGPKPQVHAPDEDPPMTDRDRKVAADLGVNADEQWPAMFDHYRRKGWTTGSWASSWRSWCRKAKEFAAEKARTVPVLRLTSHATGLDATAEALRQRGVIP